jgi:hypothetical protein
VVGFEQKDRQDEGDQGVMTNKGIFLLYGSYSAGDGLHNTGSHRIEFGSTRGVSTQACSLTAVQFPLQLVCHQLVMSCIIQYLQSIYTSAS